MSVVELVLKHPNNAPAERFHDLVAVVACEDAAMAPQVWSMLQRVGREAGGHGRLIYSWWTFAVLASPSLRHLAVCEAAEADMVVIAAPGTARLPGEVKDWLSGWVALRGEPTRPRALVALLGSDPTGGVGSQGFLSELKGLAESGRVDFFSDRCQAMQRDVAPPEARPLFGNSECRSPRRHVRAVGQVSGGRLAVEEARR